MLINVEKRIRCWRFSSSIFFFFQSQTRHFFDHNFWLLRPTFAHRGPRRDESLCCCHVSRHGEDAQSMYRRHKLHRWLPKSHQKDHTVMFLRLGSSRHWSNTTCKNKFGVMIRRLEPINWSLGQKITKRTFYFLEKWCWTKQFLNMSETFGGFSGCFGCNMSESRPIKNPRLWLCLECWGGVSPKLRLVHYSHHTDWAKAPGLGKMTGWVADRSISSILNCSIYDIK